FRAAALIVLARLRPAAVVEREAGTPLVDDALEALQQLRAAGLRRERHGPGAEPSLQAPVPPVDAGGAARDRPGRRVAWQRDRRLAIRHRLAHDDAHARILVGLQTRVGKLGRARLEPADGACG